MGDWTVRVERAPLGVGCMPRDTAFPSRHEGNYFALGHTMRERLGLAREQWDRAPARTAGCLRITAVPSISAEHPVENNASAQNASQARPVATQVDYTSALEAFVAPNGLPVLPNGAMLRVPVQVQQEPRELGSATHEALGKGITRTQVAWGSGDLFGASFVRLPPHLAGAFSRPLDSGAHTFSKNQSAHSKQMKVVNGHLVTLVRPPPVRIYAERLIVGAPRAWAGTGRKGALCVVDFVVDLLDRPIALNSAGETVRIDDRDAIEHAPKEGPDLLRKQDLQERLVVTMSNPVLLAAPGLGASLSSQSGGIAADLDSMPLHSGISVPIQDVFRPGSLLGASIATLGKLALPMESNFASSNASNTGLADSSQSEHSTRGIDA